MGSESSEFTYTASSEYGWALTGMTETTSSECDDARSYAQTSDAVSSEWEARSYSQMTDPGPPSECGKRSYTEMTDPVPPSIASSSVTSISSVWSEESPRVDRKRFGKRVLQSLAVPPSSSPFPVDGRLVADGLIRRRSGRMARRHDPARRTDADQRSTASRQAEKNTYFKGMTTAEIVKTMMIVKSILKK